MNIKNGESVSSKISKFIQKGFSFSTDKELQTDTSKTNYAILFGGVGDERVMLHIYFEQASRIVYGMNVTLLGFKNWYKLKTFYLEYLNKLKTKYGKPTEEVAKFVLPYVDGFGNEIDGVKNGKCVFGASWASKRLSISITESTNIMIQYGWYEGSLAEALDFKRDRGSYTFA